MRYLAYNIVVLFFLALPFYTLAQKSSYSGYNETVRIHPIMSLNNDFNLQDWYLGVSGGIEDVGYQWSAKLSFGFRPFKKSVQIQENEYLIRQYQEKKYFLSLDLDKRFGHLNLFGLHTQFFAGTKNGILFGTYAGTKKNPTPVWVIAPMAGVCFNFDDAIFAKIGYQFMQDQLVNVDNNRISLTFTFILK
jgi:opacity protein-like surface antigen